MRRALVSSSIALLLVLAVTGCGDDTSGTGGSSSSGTAGGDATSTSTGTDGAGGGAGGEGGGATQTPEELVPPEALGGDPAAVCPGAYASSPLVDGLNEGFDVADQSREVFVIEPDPSFEGPRPLFVAFNGTGESGPSFSNRADLEQLAARGFVVVAPSSNGNGTLWPVWDSMHAEGTDDPEANADLVLFDAVVACTAAHRPIDKNRIYLGGHSAGGIMANYVLQRRSDVLAGGIVASGVFSLTTPEPAGTLDDMFVIVTWGGDNDEYSGGSNGVSVPAINFVEQASIASVFYDEDPAVAQAHCRGDDLGHAWLPINDWFADALLAHPKGIGDAAVLPASPGGAATCSADPYLFESDVVVECPGTSAVEGCAAFCQFAGDCAVENATVGPILAPQLEGLGFSGEDNQDCGGCITHCEGAATEAADVEVLACIEGEQAASICGPGVDGALPVVDALNVCCEGRTDSPWCADACTILWTNSAVRSFIPACEPLLAD